MMGNRASSLEGKQVLTKAIQHVFEQSVSDLRCLETVAAGGKTTQATE